MKPGLMCIYALILRFFSFIPKQVSAQFDDIGSLIDASINDAGIISKAYLSPMIKGLGTGLNAGWSHSGSAKEFPQFYIAIQSGLSFIPSSERTFDIRTLNLENLTYLSGPMESPTANGPDRDGPTLQIQKSSNGSTYQMGDLTLPGGSGLNFAPSPVIQVGAGLLYNTSLIIRFVPKIIVSDASAYMNGIGIQHGLNQWIPGGNMLPVDLSVMFGYTFISGRFNLDVTPENDPEVTNPYPAQTWVNQYIQSRTTAFTMNIVAGKKLSVFHLYGGAGYESSKTSLKVIGNFPANVPDPQSGNIYHERVDKLVNPVSFSVTGAKSPHFFVGSGIELSFFKLFTEYKISNYSTLSFGLGFGI